MFYVKIKAGLGNQMFQYAFGRSLSIERNEPFSLDISYFSNQPERDAKREFLLDKFKIKAPIASEEELKKINTKIKLFFRKIFKRIKYTGTHTYYPSLMKSKSLYYEGHWENEKYFLKNEYSIRQELSLKDPFGVQAQIIENKIFNCLKRNEVPISIHIRRGDFVSNPNSAVYNGLIDIPYYKKAIELLSTKYLQKNMQVFIFSDDIEWAKK